MVKNVKQTNILLVSAQKKTVFLPFLQKIYKMYCILYDLWYNYIINCGGKEE